MPLKITTAIHKLDVARFGLSIESADEETYAFFHGQELAGDGCTWHAVVDSLVRSQLPNLMRQLTFTAEAGGLLIMSKDRKVLERVRNMVRKSIGDDETIRQAIEEADRDLLE